MEAQEVDIPIYFLNPWPGLGATRGPDIGYSTSTQAVLNAEASVLRALLSHGAEDYIKWLEDHGNNLDEGSREYFRTVFGPNAFCRARHMFGSPLLQAVRIQSAEKIAILLEAGADPNGVSIADLADRQKVFLRHRPSLLYSFFGYEDDITRDQYLQFMEEQQLGPLTTLELDLRRKFINTSFAILDYHYGLPWFGIERENLHSLTNAARGSVHIFDQLLAAGADASFWLGPHDPECIPDAPNTSTLVTTSPIHIAIECQNYAMLRHLLELGFRPNMQSLAIANHAQTPLMRALVERDMQAYKILSEHHSTNFERRTVVTRVHSLHVAVACLELETLERVLQRTTLEKANTTAFGHTLLHVACLPLTKAHIQSHIIEGDEVLRPMLLELNPLETFGSIGPPSPVAQVEDLSSHFLAQFEVAKFLCDRMPDDICALDVHGNTPLHYLAGHQVLNLRLLEYMQSLPGGLTGSSEIRNLEGFTANDFSLMGASIVNTRGIRLNIDYPEQAEHYAEVVGVEDFDKNWEDRLWPLRSPNPNALAGDHEVSQLSPSQLELDDPVE